MTKIQGIKRRDGSVVCSVNIPKTIVETLLLEKGDLVDVIHVSLPNGDKPNIDAALIIPMLNKEKEDARD